MNQPDKAFHVTQGRIGGKLGGKSTSAAKAAAARLNGKKGGWPKGRKRKPIAG